VRPFRYERADDAAAAVQLLTAEPGAAFLAGGTNLIDLMKLGVERPELLIDVTGVASDGIAALPDGACASARPCATATWPPTRRSARVTRRWRRRSSPAPPTSCATSRRQAATSCSAHAVCTSRTSRSRATSAPGSGCAAREGYHRGLAVLGHSQSCVATNPSDVAVALAAFDAVVRVQGPAGVREIALTEFHRLPGDEPQRDTVLERGELIVAVDLPALPIAARSRYRKVRDRASYAFALVSVAAAIDVEDGVVRDVRIALGGVAHKPWRATVAEAQLRGACAAEESFGRAADAELAAAEPLPANAFKVPLARATIVRTLLELVEQQ
jgi:xanthine dehydrogenase YagS FAD-binding subunit